MRLQSVPGHHSARVSPFAKRIASVDFSRFRRPRALILAAAIITLALTGGTYAALHMAPTPPPLAFSEFLKAVDAGTVTGVTFNDRTITVALRNGSVGQTVAPPDYLAANSSFITDLYRRDIRVDVTPV